MTIVRNSECIVHNQVEYSILIVEVSSEDSNIQQIL